MKIQLRTILYLLATFVQIQAWAQVIYKAPERQVSDLIDSSGFSYPVFNPQFTEFVKYRIQLTPPISYTSRPFLRLAGARFNPESLASYAGRYKMDLRYYDRKNKKDRAILFAKDSYIHQLSWSPEGSKLAVQVETPHCVELWIVKIPGLQKQKIPGACLNTALGNDNAFYWVDNKNILLQRRTKKGPIIVATVAPEGPIVSESTGVVSQNRTFQDLIKDPQEEEAFATATSAQLSVVNTETMVQRNIGGPASYSAVLLSPNAKWILVSKLEKPYSYAVPFSLFRRERSLVSIDGKHKKPLGVAGPFESLPIHGVPTGPRNLQWDSAHPQRFFYVEAQDGGDWKTKVPFRDFLYVSTVENSIGEIKTEKITAFENRFSDLTVLEDSRQGVFVSDYDRDTEVVRYFHLYPDEGGYKLKEFLRLNSKDDYADPGTLVLGRNKFDRLVGRIEKTSQGDFVYWQGAGATPDGERPFISKMSLRSLKFSEVFRSPKDKREQVWSLFPKEFSRIIMRTESATEPPTYEVRTLQSPDKGGELLFRETNPFQVMSQLKKKFLKYKRKDGVEMSGILYYPLNYKEGEKYPCVVSAYPLEYTDAKMAGQTRGSTSNFETPFRATPLYFALRGYFVLDEAQIPIVGSPENRNDTFIEQLSMNAEATIKALEANGSVDPKRVGVIGHSYGAFMVAHLLTHTNYFAAGIARSGAYNRTLTPFGFQGERRPLWEAKSTYLKLSPFLDVEKIKFPILLIHGMDDNNPGTFTLQTQRYFEALKGQGARARMVLLPAESHDYSSNETVKHVVWESFEWFDKYLKASKSEAL